ncbi:MAG: peroxiredoxin family protein [Candidatus Melainabacteria bacterium]|nr:peroxiredoxin family protein [Candidatus Melainabacteria bacterium]
MNTSGWNVWVVLVALIATVGLIGWFSTQAGSLQQGAKPSSLTETASLPPADASQSQESVLSPDLTKINPHALLNIIPPGRPAPDFSTADAQGKPVQLATLRAKGPVVLVFYQGNFCSVCRHQLMDIQSSLDFLNAYQASVLAISADDAPLSKQTQGEAGLTFTVVPDPQRLLIDKFGVRNLSKSGIAWPAVYIIGKDGTVQFSFAHEQGQRLMARDILQQLEKLAGHPTTTAPHS